MGRKFAFSPNCKNILIKGLHAGNPIFEDYALKAIHALMERRSVMDLFGSTINMINMQWTNLNGGIGASSDSFYEYLLKAYILFGT